MRASPGGAALFSEQFDEEVAVGEGFRRGAKGTHTSRTLMLPELSAVLAATPANGRRRDYAAAIIDGNCLAKPTAATRRLSNQRLGELYALDPGVALFRVLRRLWEGSDAARPLLALQCALARDPLLAATAPAITALAPGEEFQRDAMRSALRAVIDDRLGDATLEKVIRNAASSWSQSGHLVGRTFKRRQQVNASPASVAYALFLGHLTGFRGVQLFRSGWIAALDCNPQQARDLALQAKQVGLIDLRSAGELVDISFERLQRAR